MNEGTGKGENEKFNERKLGSPGQWWCKQKVKKQKLNSQRMNEWIDE